MPPNIFSDSSEEVFKSSPYLLPGAEQAISREQVYRPHVFQQSVTITAAMWNEENSKKNSDTWKFGNWGVLSEYSPLFVGLLCGFGIVLIVVTSLALWRYCLLSAGKKVCCRGTYGVVSLQVDKNSMPAKKEKKESLGGFENFKQFEVHPNRKYSILQRSATVGSIPLNVLSTSTVESESKLRKLREQNIPSNLTSNICLETSPAEPLMISDGYTSHSYLPKLDENSTEISKIFSRSTPALEDLYAKVNFSKKKKNRMRKGDAAIIAMSKSHSGNGNNSLDQTCSAIVVYDERTAL